MIKKSNKQKGLSIIEIIIAFSVLIIGFVSIIGLFPKTLSINKSSENASLASFLAQEKLENVLSKNYDDITTGTIEILHRLATSSDDYFYNFERETIVTLLDHNLIETTTDVGFKKITSNIYYNDSSLGIKKNFSLSVLCAKK